MTAKYQQTHVTGEQWLRAKRIVIDNPLDGVPIARFAEEVIVNIAGGEQFRRDVGVLEVPAGEEMLDEVIPLVDPETGEPTGESLTYAEAQVVLHSAYLHFADKRDNPPEPDEVEEEALPESGPEPEEEGEPTDG